jgi:hypothetical protein
MLPTLNSEEPFFHIVITLLRVGYPSNPFQIFKSIQIIKTVKKSLNFYILYIILENILYIDILNIGVLFMYPTKVLTKVTKATPNQIQYWAKCGFIKPQFIDNISYFSFSELIKIKLVAALRSNGLSLQKIKKGLFNLQNILEFKDIPLSNLLIITDGADIIVGEKGKYFSALTKQGYFSFDTKKLNAEVIKIYPTDLYKKLPIQKKRKEPPSFSLVKPSTLIGQPRGPS